jgi:hypothetical protein
MTMASAAVPLVGRQREIDVLGAAVDAAAMLPVIDDQAVAAGTPFMRARALRWHGLVDQDPDLLLEAVAAHRQCPRPLPTSTNSSAPTATLFISRHSVESHLKHTYRKLALSTRVELAALAAQHGDGLGRHPDAG